MDELKPSIRNPATHLYPGARRQVANRVCGVADINDKRASFCPA